MTANLYTIICEYGGGTYLSQHLGKDHIEACRDWITYFRTTSSDRSGSNLIADAVQCDFENEAFPVNFVSLKNAWCGSTLSEDKHVELFIIKTSPA
jgi:hypothetical protein